MLSLMNRTAFVSLGMSAVVILLTGSAFGTMLDYNSFVQGHSDTIICYDFEGTSAAQQQQNKAGTTNASLNDLVEVTLRDGGGEGNITYTPGFDATSTAFVPYDESMYVGKVFSTDNPLPLTNTVSYEAIVRQSSSGGWEYLVGAFNKIGGTSYRGYFTLQDNSDNDRLSARVGSGTAFTSFDLGDTVGDWCYLAISANYSSSLNQTDFTVYGANLTDGDTILSSSSKTETGSFLTGTAFGIGGLSVYGQFFQEASSAQMDQIVFYDGVKDAAFFQANLDRILAEVPEPNTMVLLMIGSIALCLIRRRG